MKVTVGIIAVILVILGATVYSTTKSSSEQPSKPVSQKVEAPKPTPPNTTEIFTLVNQERTKAGVKPLVIDDRLNKSAQVKAQDMVSLNYYGHVNPTTKKHGYDIAHDYMQECVYTSENLNNGALSQGVDSESTVSSWMNSKPHREAMLDTNYDYVGYAVSGDFIVMHLCDIQ